MNQLEDYASEDPALVPVEPPRPEPLPQDLPPVPPPGPGLTFPTLNQIQEESLRAFYHSKTRHGAIVVPVGTGKTILGMRIWDALGRPNVLVVVNRKVLIHNPWREELLRLGFDRSQIGEYYSERQSVKYPVTVTLYQSLVRHPYLMTRFDMVIFDEADVLGGEGFHELLAKSEAVPYVVGLTGTMMDAYQRSGPLRHHLPRVIERTISDAHEIGLLAPAEVSIVPVSLTHEERYEYNQLTAAFRSLMRRARAAKPQDAYLFKRKAMMVNQGRFKLLSEAEAKVPAVLSLLQDEPEATTLVFSSSVDNVTLLQNEARRVGIPCETMTAETLPDARERIIAGFGKSFKVLFSVGVLARGYNVPAVSREILVGTTSNTTTAVEQRLGRALRRDPKNAGKVAKVFIVTALNTMDLDMLSAAKRALTRI